MTTVFVRRLLSVLIAGCSVVLIGALIIGFVLFGMEHPADVSLAQRIDAKKTHFFLKTSDREMFEQLIARYVTHAIQDANAIDVQAIPMGSDYECAVLETGSGSAWVISVKGEREAGKTTTMASIDDPLLLLPITRLSSSLKKSSLVRTYVRTEDDMWLYTKPDILFGSEEGVLGKVLSGLLSEVEHILILPRGSEEGTIVLEGPHPNYFNPIMTTGLSDASTLFEIASGNPEQDLREAGRLISSAEPAIREGLSGILEHTLKSLTGRTSIEEFSATMLTGPATLTMTSSGSTTRLAFMGTSGSKTLVDPWLQLLNTSADGAYVREIVFPKRENIRRDVSQQHQNTSAKLPSLHGWELSRIGVEEGEKNLFLGRLGTKYAIATDETLLRQMIAPPLPENPSLKREAGSAIAGRIHIPWLMEKAETFGQEGRNIRNLLSRTLGDDTKDLLWDARPVNQGWLLNWSLSRSDSLSEPSLVK